MHEVFCLLPSSSFLPSNSHRLSFPAQLGPVKIPRHWSSLVNQNISEPTNEFPGVSGIFRLVSSSFQP